MARQKTQPEPYHRPQSARQLLSSTIRPTRAERSRHGRSSLLSQPTTENTAFRPGDSTLSDTTPAIALPHARNEAARRRAARATRTTDHLHQRDTEDVEDEELEDGMDNDDEEEEEEEDNEFRQSEEDKEDDNGEGSSITRRSKNYDLSARPERFDDSEMPEIDERLFEDHEHQRFRMVTIGTVKCDFCNERNNRSVMYECHGDCGWPCRLHICTPCLKENIESGDNMGRPPGSVHLRGYSHYTLKDAWLEMKNAGMDVYMHHNKTADHLEGNWASTQWPGGVELFVDQKRDPAVVKKSGKDAGVASAKKKPSSRLPRPQDYSYRMQQPTTSNSGDEGTAPEPEAEPMTPSLRDALLRESGTPQSVVRNEPKSPGDRVPRRRQDHTGMLTSVSGIARPYRNDRPSSPTDTIRPPRRRVSIDSATLKEDSDWGTDDEAELTDPVETDSAVSSPSASGADDQNSADETISPRQVRTQEALQGLSLQGGRRRSFTPVSPPRDHSRVAYPESNLRSTANHEDSAQGTSETNGITSNGNDFLHGREVFPAFAAINAPAPGERRGAISAKGGYATSAPRVPMMRLLYEGYCRYYGKEC